MKQYTGGVVIITSAALIAILNNLQHHIQHTLNYISDHLYEQYIEPHYLKCYIQIFNVLIRVLENGIITIKNESVSVYVSVNYLLDYQLLTDFTNKDEIIDKAIRYVITGSSERVVETNNLEIIFEDFKNYIYKLWSDYKSGHTLNLKFSKGKIRYEAPVLTIIHREEDDNLHQVP